MTMLATADALADHLRTSFDDTQESQAEALLTAVSGLVDGYCNRVAFERVEDDEVVLTGTWSLELFLPLGPVESVSSVKIDGTLVPASEYELVGGVLHRTAGRSEAWGGRNANLTVVYTHGFAADATPEDVEAVVLERAARRWPNPEQLRGKQLHEAQINYQTDSGGLTDSEKAQLRRYRIDPREKR